jgi:hypothetical protein
MQLVLIDELFYYFSFAIRRLNCQTWINPSSRSFYTVAVI